ncbi:MAG: condensation domain-containing protein, partial [Bacteroidota bacterium]
WRILLDHLGMALEALQNKQPIELGLKTTSYQAWGSLLKKQAVLPRMKQQLPYWEEVVQQRTSLPVDFLSSPTQMKDVKEHIVYLATEPTTTLLTIAQTGYQIQIEDLLLSALGQTLCRWSGNDRLTLSLEGHGRMPISDTMDTSNTIGWFTNLYPVVLNMETGAELGALIRSVQQQMVAIPDKGLGYGVLRYLHPSETIRTALSGTQQDVVFNYLGQMDNSIQEHPYFGLAQENVGAFKGPDYPFHCKLEINCSILEGQLKMSWSYSSKQYRAETIAQLANQYLNDLVELIDYCVAQQGVGQAVSDASWVQGDSRSDDPSASAADRSPALQAISDTEEELVLYCVPGAGGEITSFYQLGNLLDTKFGLYAFQAYGLDGATPALESIESMASAYIVEIQKRDPYGPYYLGGYSFGAKVVYEMALQLERAGYEVAQLIIFDAPAPQHTKTEGTVTTRAAYLLRIARFFMKHMKRECWLSIDDFSDRTAAEGAQFLSSYLTAQGLEISAARVNGFAEVGVNNSRANREYIPTVRQELKVPVLLFKATELSEELKLHFESEALQAMDYSWSEATRGEVRTVIVSGDHHTLLNEPHVRQVAQRLSTNLQEQLDQQTFSKRKVA